MALASFPGPRAGGEKGLVSTVFCPCANPFPPNDALRCHETFSFMMSHPAMSLGDRFCDSRKGGTGGGGWVHPEGANSMAMSGLSDRKVLVGTAWPEISILAAEDIRL